MALNLRGRSFLTLLDYSPKEIAFLLKTSAELKTAKYNRVPVKSLEGKNVVLLFEKDSTRTRCAFQVGATDLGAGVTYLGPTGSQMGKKESIKDTARVLGGMYDGIEYRGFDQTTVETLAKYSGVPVWNGLTNEFHPTQILADFLTVQEHFGRLEGIKFVFVGDGRNNMANSLLIGSAKMGLDFTILAPKELHTEAKLFKQVEAIAKETGAKVRCSDNVKEATKNADVIYTDVWVSMGEPDEVWEKRIKQLKPYQVNGAMMKNASKDAIFLHCLPAFHDTDTKVGKEIAKKFGITEMEVSDEVFESSQSKVFEQAENRLHTIKAVMHTTLGG